MGGTSAGGTGHGGAGGGGPVGAGGASGAGPGMGGSGPGMGGAGPGMGGSGPGMGGSSTTGGSGGSSTAGGGSNHCVSDSEFTGSAQLPQINNNPVMDQTCDPTVSDPSNPLDSTNCPTGAVCMGWANDAGAPGKCINPCVNAPNSMGGKGVGLGEVCYPGYTCERWVYIQDENWCIPDSPGFCSATKSCFQNNSMYGCNQDSDCCDMDCEPGTSTCCHSLASSCGGNNDCCTKNCGSSGTCCIGSGDQANQCFKNEDCCDSNCTQGSCCFPAGQSCNTTKDCCAGSCDSGTCCGNLGDSCGSSFDCCSDPNNTVECNGGQCCYPNGSSCSQDGDCCSGTCDSGTGNCM
jgi:hypothetical protein